MMKKGIALLMVVLIVSVGAAAAMPIQCCSPQQAADIMLMPTYQEIATLKADLVSGEITFDEWKAEMNALKFRLELKTLILEAIRDSVIMSYDEKLEALFAVFPWNVRGC